MLEVKSLTAAITVCETAANWHENKAVQLGYAVTVGFCCHNGVSLEHDGRIRSLVPNDIF